MSRPPHTNSSTCEATPGEWKAMMIADEILVTHRLKGNRDVALRRAHQLVHSKASPGSLCNCTLGNLLRRFLDNLFMLHQTILALHLLLSAALSVFVSSSLRQVLSFFSGAAVPSFFSHCIHRIMALRTAQLVLVEGQRWARHHLGRST